MSSFIPNNYLWDTNSLLNIVRYYLPFDQDKTLYNWLQSSFVREESFLLQSTYDEISRISQGIILKELDFLKGQRTIRIDTVSPKVHNLIDNNWIDRRNIKRKNLAEEEVKRQKQIFINSGDCQLIIFAMQDTKRIIITEETSANNDGKIFQKIPKICQQQGIKIFTLPNLLAHLNFTMKIIQEKK